MFSQACVKNSVNERGVYAWQGGACMAGDMHGWGLCVAGETAIAAGSISTWYEVIFRKPF